MEIMDEVVVLNVDVKILIREILNQHVGKENAIKVDEIALLIGLKKNDVTHYTLRRWIFESSKMYKFPLGSHSRGYYIIENRDELDDYCHNLKGRVNGIEDRMSITMSNFFRND